MTDAIQLGSEPATSATGASRKRGRFRLFFGMAPGVGKTHAMLQAARIEKLAGRDAAIANLETHGSKTLPALVQGWRRIPPRTNGASGGRSDLDVDDILAAEPHLVVVDDLAYANAPGGRHPHRYQDALELVEAGIDVYATLQVQNVASRAEAVRQITGLPAGETVPDSVLDAVEIELVDVAPETLSLRLREGLPYLTRNSELARVNFFSEGNLIALRELTLRLVAERAGREARKYRRAHRVEGPAKSGHQFLAVIDSGPAAEPVARWAGQLAESLNAPWLALFVETPRGLTDAESARLTQHLALAEELGAEIVTTTDDDPARGILRVASQRNATQIILGKPRRPAGLWRRRDSLAWRLAREGSGLDLHLVPGAEEARGPRFAGVRVKSSWRQYLLAAGLVFAVTLGSFLLEPIVGPHAIALIYLLAVVVLGMLVGRGPTLLAATMSALLWDYFMLPPVYDLRVTKFEDILWLGMYFAVALVMGQLTTRIRAQERDERQREERATALYLLTRELAAANSQDEMLGKVAQHMRKVFGAEVAILLPGPIGGPKLEVHPATGFQPGGLDLTAAAWAMSHDEPAGRFTSTLPSAEALYAPLATASGAAGVIGLRRPADSPLNTHQRSLLDAFCQQIALALDRHRLQAVSERAKLLAESERLSKTLLDSMSHEIRTPIAVINGAIGNLVDMRGSTLSAPQASMIAEIQEATLRLNRLVGNILDITRLESGNVKPKRIDCDVSDLINVTVAETEKQLARHRFSVTIAPRMPLVRMDFVLVQQALMNLLSNAAFHTPPGSEVSLAARIERESLLIEVADRGPGLAPESLARVFEKFYRGPRARAGGVGLGLSLVKGFIEAQGGRVRAENRSGGGASFAISLPLDQATPVAGAGTL